MSVDIVCGYKVLRELGTRALPSYAAIDPKPRRPEDALCVIERLARTTEGGVSAEAAAEFLRDAKRLSQVRHANLVQVRDVIVGTSTVLLVTDWVDGEVYSDIQRLAAEQGVPIPLAGSLRVVMDLLEGLSALHEVSDAKREPLRIVHSEVAPRNIVVGVDGRSVLVHPLRAPMGPGPARSHAADVVGYLAPEVLLGDQTADQRADVYGAGVLLWEALSGQRMHADGEDAGEIVMRLLGGKIDAPCAPIDAPWAAPLAQAAKKAVSPDPSIRFANATEMLADVRRVVGARLAPKLTVAALVEAVAGERIRARNAGLGATRTVARLPSESAWTTEAPAPTPPVATASPLDPEATKPPPSIPPPASSRPRVTPSWGKIRTPPRPDTARGSAAPSAPPRPSVPHPAPASGSIPVSVPLPSEPPTSADVVEVVEMEVPQDKPSRPHQPPPVPRREKPSAVPHPAPPVRVELTESRTDMAALVSSRAPSGGARARWTIAAACAIAAGAILWMLTRTSGSARTESADPPSPSVAASAGDTPPPNPATSAPPATANAPAHAANDPSPFDPPPTDDHPSAHTAPAPPIPTVRSTPPAAPAAAPAPAPAASSTGAAAHGQDAPSTHPKKRVYDPMGI